MRVPLFLILLILPGLVLARTPTSTSGSSQTHRPTPTPEPLDIPSREPSPTPTPLPFYHGQLTVVEFEKEEPGSPKKKISVTMGYSLLRFEMPDDKLNFIYNPETQTYVGLEVSNATWWTFSWPQVEAGIRKSKRYDNRVQEMTLDGLDAYIPQSTPSPTPTPTPEPTLPPVDTTVPLLPGATPGPVHTPTPAPGPSIPDILGPPPAVVPDTSSSTPSSGGLPDTSIYLWSPTNKKKVVSGLLCTLWLGTNPSGDTLRAWCITSAVPDISNAIEKMRVVNEPMALVPIHELVPTMVFAVYDQLQKSNTLPIEIEWGPVRSENMFRCLAVKEESYSDKLFIVPKTFRSTTLNSLDGIK